MPSLAKTKGEMSTCARPPPRLRSRLPLAVILARPRRSFSVAVRSRRPGLLVSLAVARKGGAQGLRSIVPMVRLAVLVVTGPAAGAPADAVSPVAVAGSAAVGGG